MRGLIDARCTCAKCEARTTDVYRMVGYCENCRADLLGLFRSGDLARTSNACPCCGVLSSCRFTRLATDDELPTDFEPSREEGKQQ